MQTNRLQYFVYRCTLCRRPLTRLQIISKWESWERDGTESRGICPCGSGKVSPSNPTLWEEITTPSIWVLWWKEVALPWLSGNRR